MASGGTFVFVSAVHVRLHYIVYWLLVKAETVKDISKCLKRSFRVHQLQANCESNFNGHGCHEKGKRKENEGMNE